MPISGRLALLALAAAVAGIAPPQASAPAAVTRTVYFSASDASGAPVTNLSVEDLIVKEDGKERVITSLKPATATMDISILVDDNASGVYQLGVQQFLQTMLGHARFAITTFNPQAIKILDYTDDIAALQDALTKLGRRGRIATEDEQLLEAIYNASKELQERRAARPIIFVLTISGDPGQNPDITLTQLLRSGASLNALFVSGAGLVLGDGPRLTGGRIERVTASLSIGPAITNITTPLLNQYALTYTLPAGVKPSDRVSVSTTRFGVSVLAPSRIPSRI
jgi:hypothetical protein